MIDQEKPTWDDIQVITWEEAQEELKHLHPEYEWEVRWVVLGDTTFIEFTMKRGQVMYTRSFPENRLKAYRGYKDRSIAATIGKWMVDVFERKILQ